jgi:21S rRNA (uridine2791-2'-O)-methyltransferase
VEKTKPNGRVIGIDLIPAQPPRGVATFQGDFLSPDVQEMVKNFILESHRRPPPLQNSEESDSSDPDEIAAIDRPSYLDMEFHTSQDEAALPETETAKKRLVDVC